MSRTGTAGFLLVALLFGGSVIAEELKGPRISVAEARRDLGTVEQGAHPEHVFAISNTGDADLEIRHIQTGWGCTAGLVSSNRLAPGATAQLKVSVDTTGRSGTMIRHVTIHSNDRATPALPVTLTVTVAARTTSQQ